MPSSSRSSLLGGVQVSPAASGHLSHASPMPSPSASACPVVSIGRIGLKTFGQLSIASGTPSPSLSAAVSPETYCDAVADEDVGPRYGTQLGSFLGVLSLQKK